MRSSDVICLRMIILRFVFMAEIEAEARRFTGAADLEGNFCARSVLGKKRIYRLQQN